MAAQVPYEGTYLDFLVTLLIFGVGKMSLRLPAAEILYPGDLDRKCLTVTG